MFNKRLKTHVKSYVSVPAFLQVAHSPADLGNTDFNTRIFTFTKRMATTFPLITHLHYDVVRRKHIPLNLLKRVSTNRQLGSKRRRKKIKW